MIDLFKYFHPLNTEKAVIFDIGEVPIMIVCQNNLHKKRLYFYRSKIRIPADSINLFKIPTFCNVEESKNEDKEIIKYVDVYMFHYTLLIKLMTDKAYELSQSIENNIYRYDYIISHIITVITIYFYFNFLDYTEKILYVSFEPENTSIVFAFENKIIYNNILSIFLDNNDTLIKFKIKINMAYPLRMKFTPIK